MENNFNLPKMIYLNMSCLKKQAVNLKKKKKISHSQALNELARRYGYQKYEILLKTSKEYNSKVPINLEKLKVNGFHFYKMEFDYSCEERIKYLNLFDLPDSLYTTITLMKHRYEKDFNVDRLLYLADIQEWYLSMRILIEKACANPNIISRTRFFTKYSVAFFSKCIEKYDLIINDKILSQILIHNEQKWYDYLKSIGRDFTIQSILLAINTLLCTCYTYNKDKMHRLQELIDLLKQKGGTLNTPCWIEVYYGGPLSKLCSVKKTNIFFDFLTYDWYDSKKTIGLLQILIENGANLNEFKNSENTFQIFYTLLAKEYIEVKKFLETQGFNLKDYISKDMLNIVLKYPRMNKLEYVKFLLENGLTVESSIKDKNELYSILSSKFNKDIKEYLEKKNLLP